MFGETIGRMLWIPLVLSLANGVLGVLPDFGACPTVKTVENFDMQKYLGKWYEAERYFSLLSVGTKCCASNYTMGEDGALNVIASHISTISRADSSAVGRVEPIGKSGEPKLNVRWDSMGFPYTTTYSILATDYANYSVEWSCANVGILSASAADLATLYHICQGHVETAENPCRYKRPYIYLIPRWFNITNSEKLAYRSTFDVQAGVELRGHPSIYWTQAKLLDSGDRRSHTPTAHLMLFKSAWIMTRQRTPPVSVLESAYQALDRNQISRAYLFRTDQKNCPEDY